MCGSRGDISQTPPPTHTHTQICANLNIPRTFPLEKKIKIKLTLRRMFLIQKSQTRSQLS